MLNFRERGERVALKVIWIFLGHAATTLSVTSRFVSFMIILDMFCWLLKGKNISLDGLTVHFGSSCLTSPEKSL